MKKNLLLFFVCICFGAFSQELSEEEKKLYNNMMEYRKSLGLPVIPISKSLTMVAQIHVKDLVENMPDLNESCNAHSWSNKGKWTACCYTKDHAQAQCIWSKPRELTNYKGDGFEIACGSNKCCSTFVMTAEYALDSWKKSPGHHAVVINQGVWKADQWKAIGIAIYRGFAVAWFGKDEEAP